MAEICSPNADSRGLRSERRLKRIWADIYAVGPFFRSFQDLQAYLEREPAAELNQAGLVLLGGDL